LDVNKETYKALSLIDKLKTKLEFALKLRKLGLDESNLKQTKANKKKLSTQITS